MSHERLPERRPDEPAAAALSVRVNGALQRVPVAATISDLVRLLGMEGRRIAVAVNREVVARSRFDETRLADGDRVEILEAVGGG